MLILYEYCTSWFVLPWGSGSLAFRKRNLSKKNAKALLYRVRLTATMRRTHRADEETTASPSHHQQQPPPSV